MLFFVNFLYIVLFINQKSIKMNNYKDLFSVYGEYDGKFYLETYKDHKEAYSRFSQLSFKMLQRATKQWKKNPDLIPQYYETTTNGFDKSSHCRIGHIYIDRIPEEHEIN